MKWSFLIIMLLSVQLSEGQFLNQAGYLPGEQKRIFLEESFAGKAFTVTDSNKKVIYKGKAGPASFWKYSGTSIVIADIPDLNDEGEYELCFNKPDLKIMFTVTRKEYGKLSAALIKSYYHARASIDISREFGEKYARKEGHPDTVVYIHHTAASAARPAGSIISSPGGWYDAGDYNKYIVNSSITSFTLLHALQLFPSYFSKLNLNIPESGNNLPDLLDETLYNLRWMLSMQDPEDGGVYHKLTSLSFCGMIMPDEDKLPRYVVMKSTAATLDFAATMAKASRVLRPYSLELPGLADSCLNMAEKAWEWSRQNPEVIYRQAEDVSTGAYGDNKLEDEWNWAATELYLATRKDSYLQASLENKAEYNIVPEWRRVSMLGAFSVLAENEKPSQELWDKCSTGLFTLADEYYDRYCSSPFRVSINVFPWGSNGEVANQGVLFIQAYLASGERRYLDAASASLDYLLGANPTGYCFITGFGNKSPMYIHERRSESDGVPEPVPGLLVGGPSLQARNDCGKEAYPSDFPALSYYDNVCSYSTNEIAINWNAPAVFLVSALDYLLK